VRMRSRKPCVLARRRLFGWKVRLLTVRLQQLGDRRRSWGSVADGRGGRDRQSGRTSGVGDECRDHRVSTHIRADNSSTVRIAPGSGQTGRSRALIRPLRDSPAEGETAQSSAPAPGSGSDTPQPIVGLPGPLLGSRIVSLVAAWHARSRSVGSSLCVHRL
jgi:hypothetical protein